MVPRVRSLAPAHLPSVGHRVGDEVERGAAQPLAGEHVRDAGRIGREGLGGDAPLGLGERDHLLRPEEGLARGHLRWAPGRGRGEGGSRLGGVGPKRLGGVPEPGDQALSGLRDALADPEYRDDHVLGVELEPDVVRPAHVLGDLVAGGAGSANVDRDAQRIPGEDALRLGDLLVEHIESGDLDDPPRSALSEAIVSASSSRPAITFWRRAASREAVRSAFGLVDSTRVTDRSTMRPSIMSEPRWRIADWVRLPPSLWTELRTTSAPQASALAGSSSEKARWAPQDSSTTSGHAAGVRDLREPGDVGDRAEVGG